MAQAVMYVELTPTTVGIKQKVEKDLDGSFATIEKKGSGVFGKIAGFAAGAGIAVAGAAAALTGLAIKGGFDRLLNIEDAQAKLSGLGHTTETVTQIMDNALASVKGTAFGLDDAATVAATAVAAGIQPGAELERVLRLTADAATIAGSSLGDMGSIFGKVAATGKLTGEVVAQLQDRGVPILQFVAEQMGVTAEAAADMVSRGEVDFKTFADAMEQNLGGAALKSGETTRGAFANMKAALSRVGVALIEGVFPFVQPALSAATGFLDDLTTKISPFTETVMGVLAPLGPIFTNAFSTIGPAIVPILSGIGAAFGTVFDAIAPLLPQLIDAALKFSPILQVVQQLGPVIGQLAGVFAGVLASALTTLLPFVIQFAGLIGGLIAQVLPLLIPLLTTVGEIFGAVFAAVLPLVAALLEPIMSIFSALVPVIVSLLSAILPVVAVLIEALAPILTLVAGIIQAVLVPIFGVLAEVIKFLAGIIVWLVDNIVVPYFKNILVPAITLVGDIFRNVFGGLGDFFGGLWGGIQSGFKGFINFIIDGINNFISGLNAIGGAISAATGGAVDISIGRIPRLAAGGYAQSVTGGSLAVIGEGRYDEAVLPLGGPQLEKIRAALSGGSQSARGDINLSVYEAHEDGAVLGNKMGRQIAMQLGRR